jgi:NADH-quinone oxidoreductase subunit M
MLGMFALNRLGTQGAVLQMVNHGLSTGGLFALVGMLYERYHTREISQLSGLTYKLPVLAFFMLVFTFSSICLPGLNGFAGEILILMGAFQRGWADSPLWVGNQLRWVSVLAVTGVVLGAWYMLWLVRRVFFGPLREPPRDADQPAVRDLSWREIMALAPLVLFIVWIGICPQFFLAPMADRVNLIADGAAAHLDDYQPKTVIPEDNLSSSALSFSDVVIHVD